MSTDGSERLIDSLTADARPVRRLRPPLVRAALWIAVAVTVVAVTVVVHGVRPDLLDKAREPLALLEWLAAVATGIGAFLAAFHLSLPDRSSRWALAAIVPAAVWLATLGLGCLADFLADGMAAFAWGTSWSCFRYITEMGLPLTIVVLLALRHAGPVRPVATMLAAGLGAAALSAAGLTLFHGLDAAWLVLIWHGLALLAVIGAASLGGAILRRVYAFNGQRA